MQKVNQRHYVVEILDDQSNTISPIVDEVGVRINEYVEMEDVTADFDIDFVFDPTGAFDVTRSEYEITVTLTGTQSADDVLDAIAGDLFEMYDQMDSDYDDDVYDLRLDLDINTSRPGPPPPPAPPTSESAEVDLEDAIEGRLLAAIPNADTSDSRATVNRMARTVKTAALADVTFDIQNGDMYSVVAEGSEVQVTLVDRRDANTMGQVISDIANVMSGATKEEVSAEVEEVITESRTATK